MFDLGIMTKEHTMEIKSKRKQRMSVQLHTGTSKLHEIAPVRNRLFTKPYGGLWTSSYDVESGSDWLDFVTNDSGLRIPENAVLLTVHPKARVYTIDTYADLHILHSRYKFDVPEEFKDLFFFESVLDFEKIAEDYDGIHLTMNGQYETRMSRPLNLYGWDVESTVWFRDVFIKKIPVGKLTGIIG